MPRIERTAQLSWDGNVARGHGAITAGSGAFSDLEYSLPARIGKPEGKTSPEELLAAAHATCYATSIAGEIARAGIDRGGFDRAVAAGHAGCPFSRLLERSGADVQVKANLEEE